jgi:hypothetical protein
VEYLPAAQAAQVLSCEAPGVVEYLPAAQAAQVQKVQSHFDVLPVGEVMFSGQA